MIFMILPEEQVSVTVNINILDTKKCPSIAILIPNPNLVISVFNESFQSLMVWNVSVSMLSRICLFIVLNVVHYVSLFLYSFQWSVPFIIICAKNNYNCLVSISPVFSIIPQIK